MRETTMAENVYKIIELVGTSTESWEKAASAAIKRASKTLRDLRVAEVSELDMQLKDGKVEAYRAKVKVSFKYEGDSSPSVRLLKRSKNHHSGRHTIARWLVCRQLLISQAPAGTRVLAVHRLAH